MLEADVRVARAGQARLHDRLPQVDPTQARRRNGWLLALNQPGADGMGLSAQIAEPLPGPALRFSGEVWITPEVIDAAPAAWIATASSSALPEALVAFSALEPLLQALERAMGTPLDPQAIETPAGTELTLRVAQGAHVARVTLGASAATPRPVAGPRAPVGAAAQATIACRLALQGPLAPVDELASLAPGDLVTTPSSPDGIKGWLSAPGVGTVAGRVRPDSACFVCEGPMDSTMPPEPAEAPPAGSLPGGLTVRLRLELGAIDVTLAELAALAPGAVLPVEALGDAPVVTLTAPGAVLATGRLVALGTGYGVLVDHVAAQDAAAA